MVVMHDSIKDKGANLAKRGPLSARKKKKTTKSGKDDEPTSPEQASVVSSTGATYETPADMSSPEFDKGKRRNVEDFRRSHSSPFMKTSWDGLLDSEKPQKPYHRTPQPSNYHGPPPPSQYHHYVYPPGPPPPLPPRPIHYQPLSQEIYTQSFAYPTPISLQQPYPHHYVHPYPQHPQQQSSPFVNVNMSTQSPSGEKRAPGRLKHNNYDDNDDHLPRTDQPIGYGDDQDHNEEKIVKTRKGKMSVPVDTVSEEESLPNERSITNGRRKRLRRDSDASFHLSEAEEDEAGADVFQTPEVEYPPFEEVGHQGVRTPGKRPLKKKKKERRPIRHWTYDEMKALYDGMVKYQRNWALIKKEYPVILHRRTPVDLKDKARTERKARERLGLSLGVFELVSGLGGAGAQQYA